MSDDDAKPAELDLKGKSTIEILAQIDMFSGLPATHLRRVVDIGIEEQYLERVFGLFQRLHDRDRYEGSGMGLAIAKRIVERHGGRMWITSTPGTGSQFFFTLPTARRSSEAGDEGAA